MKSATGVISLLVTAVLGVGIYLYFLKKAAPGPGMVATQAISVTGVKNDLISIAQAERMYYVQNGSYADLATLASSGTMNITRTSRDGYTYSVDSSETGFTVTARYTATPLEMPPGVAPPRFPTISVDQTMEVHQDD
jgi:Type IV minor pilin ComP, DNA uptake sequence receptor